MRQISTTEFSAFVTLPNNKKKSENKLGGASAPPFFVAKYSSERISNMSIIWHYHHWIPRHKGGTDDKSNLVKMNPACHAFIHKCLWEENGDMYDYIAWKAISGQITHMEATVMATKVANTGKAPWNKGKTGVSGGRPKGMTHTEESRKIISERTKEGMKKTNKKIGTPKDTEPWNKGKKTQPHSEERKKKIGAAVKARKQKCPINQF
jgi:hypothetical protein